MKIIVDTCVWSMALRRDSSQESDVVKELIELIKEVRVQMLGPIRQELLSGIKTTKQFNHLKHNFAAYSDLALEMQDYEKAAEFYNTCRSNGIQGSNTDFLICSAAFFRGYEIFTSDKDFELFQNYIPVKLYQMRTV